MVCSEHKSVNEKLNTIITDVAVIKQCLLGNDGKNDGMVDKVNKHDMYFYVVAGCLICCGWALGNLNLHAISQVVK